MTKERSALTATTRTDEPHGVDRKAVCWKSVPRSPHRRCRRGRIALGGVDRFAAVNGLSPLTACRRMNGLRAGAAGPAGGSYCFRFALVTVTVLLVFSSGCQTLHRNMGQGRDSAEYHRWEQGGRDALRHNRLEQAESYLARAMELAPRDAQVLEQYADLCQRRGDVGRAIEVLTRAVDASDGQPELRVKLGECFLDNGYWLPASRQAQLALDTNRHCPDAWVLKGRIQMAKENHAEAMACFQRALSINPDQANVQIYLAQTHAQMGEPMRAISCLEQLLSQYPVGQQPEAALIALGKMLSEMGRHHAAIEKLYLAARQRDATAAAWVALAQAQRAGGYRRQAVATLETAAQRFPEVQPVTDLLVAWQRELEPEPGVLQAAWQPAFQNKPDAKRWPDAKR